jgi:chromate transporter
MRELVSLFTVFARIGAVMFGGGYAMLPILQREIVEKRQWATESELADYYAVGQCTPGVIAVNTATFIGAKRKGVAGGIVATLGIVFPSIVIITIIAACLSNFASLPAVQNAFAGIRVCVCVLIFNAVRRLIHGSLVDVPTVCIFALTLLIGTLTDLSPVILVLLAGTAGVVIQKARRVL